MRGEIDSGRVALGVGNVRSLPLLAVRLGHDGHGNAATENYHLRIREVLWLAGLWFLIAFLFRRTFVSGAASHATITAYLQLQFAASFTSPSPLYFAALGYAQSGRVNSGSGPGRLASMRSGAIPFSVHATSGST